MKITKSQLKKVIKEELMRMLNENPDLDPYDIPVPNLPSRNPYRPSMDLETAGAQEIINRVGDAYEESLQGEDTDAIAALLFSTIYRMLTTPSDEDDPNSPLVYEDEVAPAMVQLAELTVAQDYATIRSNFNRMWTDLIRWHRDTGILLLPRISHNFRTIDTIVRNLPLDRRT
jgi:hypothetical protein